MSLPDSIAKLPKGTKIKDAYIMVDEAYRNSLTRTRREWINTFMDHFKVDICDAANLQHMVIKLWSRHNCSA